MKLKLPKTLVRASMLSCALTLVGCATLTNSNGPTKVSPKPEPVQSSYCLVAKPIYWSAKDTDDTIRQIKEHNAVWKELCGDKKPLTS